MTRIYLFSGMGADTRLFTKIGPIEGYEIVPLPYIPRGEATTLREYAELLAAHYTFKPPYLLGGVSQGGMIAQELAQIIDPHGLVLISTATSRAEMPRLFEWLKQIRMTAVWSKSILEPFATLADRFTIKSAEGRKLFLDMLRDSDSDFMKFSAQAILEWQPPTNNVPVIRIHGTKDQVFSPAKIKDAIMVEGGNHFMIIERGEEITKILREALD